MASLNAIPGVESIRVGCCDLLSAVQQADTIDELLRLREAAEAMALEISTCEAAALEKADRLVKAMP